MGGGIPPRWELCLDLGGTKTRLWVHYKVKININYSSQYIRLHGWEEGRGGGRDRFC